MADPTLTGAGEALWQATDAIYRSGVPLMTRVLPKNEPLKAWAHCPPRDVVNGLWQARWFYHCHSPDDKKRGEHGHFHLFLGRRGFSKHVLPLIAPPTGRRPRPSVVHIAALSIDHNGLPTGWSVTNRWVTDEWLYPSAAIISKARELDFCGDNGDPLVNAWLGTMLHASHDTLSALLFERDRILLHRDPAGENRAIETVAQAPVDMNALIQ